MTQQNISPQSQPYRSYIYRQLQAAGAHFTQCRQAAIAAGFSSRDAEQAQLKRLCLADLTPLPRLGFKGAGVPEWLQSQGVAIPHAANTTARDSQHGLIARLGFNEIMLLADAAVQGEQYDRLVQTWQAGGTDVPAQANLLLRAHSHACFGLYGGYADRVFAKLCAVDLRPDFFKAGDLVMTSVARVAATVIRDDVISLPVYKLLVDGGYAVYMLDCLADAMSEYDGDFIGVEALADLIA